MNQQEATTSSLNENYGVDKKEDVVGGRHVSSCPLWKEST